MIKYLIIQSFVGNGTWWNDDENLDYLYNTILIPSVAKYCSKYDYKHAVHRDQYDLITMANLKSDTTFGNLYHQYLSALKHQEDDVDYIVFMDSDFYVTSTALPLVQTSCIKGNVWTDDQVELWGRGKDPKTFTAVMGGIQILKKEAAINLAEYIKSRLIDYVVNDSPMTLMPDEITVGEWMGKYNIKPEKLSQYYNWLLEDIRDRPWDEKDTAAGFWHFCGQRKAEKLSYVLEHIDGLK
jgi:hypothetical protein